MFKDDPLLSSPGASYLYTTHGWTLISAVVEMSSVNKQKRGKNLSPTYYKCLKFLNLIVQ